MADEQPNPQFTCKYEENNKIVMLPLLVNIFEYKKEL